ncbi:MAG: PPC domain-containing protein, partial [Gemmatimonadaceae bacterium]
MIHKPSIIADSPARLRWVAASIVAGVLLATSCSEGGITPPAPEVKSPTLDAAIVRDSSAVAADAGVNTGALTNGGNHTGTISVAGQTDTWTFSATQGQYLVVGIGEITGSADFTPWIRLVDPNGTTIGNQWNVLAAQIGVAATVTGTYTVLVATADAGNNGTGDYRLTAAQLQGNFIVSPGDQGGAMTNGSNHTGALLIGDLDLWSFSATQGDQITLAIGKVTGTVDFTPWIRLIAPNGAVLGNSWGTGAAQISVAAPSTGVYTVVVSTADAGNDGTGDYSLTLAKGPGAIVISPGDQGGPMTNGANHSGTIQVGDLDAWTFTATQGDYLMLAVGEVTGSADFTPWIRLVSPNGTVIGNSWNVLAAQIGVNAPLTGTYLVIVSTADAGLDGNGDYKLTLAKGPGALVISPGDQGGPMTNGANHAGTITVGDLDAFTFTANQGEAIVVAVGEVTGSADFTPWIRMVAPNGTLVANTWNVAAAQLAVNAPATGTYMVVVSTADAGNDANGTYSLTLAKAPGTFTTSPGDQGGTATNGGNDTGT